MCFVWISKQTEIISLYNINWLVFITETECVYCAVRNECFNVIQINLSRRPLRMRARVWSRPVHVRFMVDRVALGQVSIRVLRFPPVSIIPPMLRIYLSTCCFYQKDRRAKPGSLPNSNARQKTRRSWIEKYFDLAFKVFRSLRSQHRNSWTLPRSRLTNNHDTCLFMKAEWDWTPKLTDWLTDWLTDGGQAVKWLVTYLDYPRHGWSVNVLQQKMRDVCWTHYCMLHA